jgi:hypothetical protein
LRKLSPYPLHGGRIRTLRLDGTEFVRRFLLHVLPKGLMRIRHFGFLANRIRHTMLERIRQALAVPESVDDAVAEASGSYPCPHCRTGRLQVIAVFPPIRHWAKPPGWFP